MGFFRDGCCDTGRGTRSLLPMECAAAMRWCAHWILTFRDLHNGVCRMVNVLRSLGVSAGDRVMLLAKDARSSYGAHWSLRQAGF